MTGRRHRGSALHASSCAAFLACSLASGTAMALPDGPYGFDCGDKGSMLINPSAGTGISKAFPGVRPSEGEGFVRLFTVPVPCGDASLFCLREGIDPLSGNEQTHVFAFPRRMHGGERYEVDGYVFSVSELRRDRAGRMSVEIAVVPPRDLSGRYTLRVEDRRGLVGVRFESLAGPAGVRREVERRLGTVDCTADANRPGLFHGVRLSGGSRRP